MKFNEVFVGGSCEKFYWWSCLLKVCASDSPVLRYDSLADGVNIVFSRDTSHELANFVGNRKGWIWHRLNPPICGMFSVEPSTPPTHRSTTGLGSQFPRPQVKQCFMLSDWSSADKAQRKRLSHSICYVEGVYPIEIIFPCCQCSVVSFHSLCVVDM
jgi:hypothetical protein